MANNLATTLFHVIFLFFAATNPLAIGESCACPSDDFTVYGNVPTQGGATLAPPGRGGRVVAILNCATTRGTVERIGRSTVDSDGSFNITVPEAQLFPINFNQSTVPCAVHVPLSFADGFLGSGLRRCDYVACRGVTRVIRCLADTFDNVLFPCDV